jgi:hypothetical protein
MSYAAALRRPGLFVQLAVARTAELMAEVFGEPQR